MQRVLQEGTEPMARAVEYDEYPLHGHMMIVAPTFDAAYWLTDRHATLHPPGKHATTVQLEGEGQTLLEARTDEQGIIDFNEATQYNGPDLRLDTPAGNAYVTLHDPDVIQRVLFPPYIADVMARPLNPALNDPDGLIWCDPIALHAGRKLLLWVWTIPDVTVPFAAPILDSGAVDWGSAEQQENLPSELRRDIHDLTWSIPFRD
ncbi:hypothetical protein OG339_48000 (plasmid) [Streptosporangium sp. NBC_01495]|uniref:hypothetical protein n=1 Tax=Streptosporangium sp. NBC_01495 TaxID=2903899 RepID=UPI002E31918C|nr:hypothetical protein [Streptosporangium sp. NBC_01495]